MYAATQRSDDSFALFKVWEGVKEVHYVGEVLYFLSHFILQRFMLMCAGSENPN